MSDPINLNRARKARDKASAKARAAENRVRHGRTKADRLKLARVQDAAAKALDGARLDGSTVAARAPDLEAAPHQGRVQDPL